MWCGGLPVRCLAACCFVATALPSPLTVQSTHEALDDLEGDREAEERPGKPSDRVVYPSGITGEAVENFLVYPEHKLLFCMIQKVGCSNFQDLFRFARSVHDPSQLKTKYSANTPAHHNLTVKDLDKMLRDGSWHKAVFLRDPLERFASAWNSKCVPDQGDKDGPFVCKKQFGVSNLSFPSAVLAVADFDLQYSIHHARKVFNNHFQAMSHYCGGLGHTVHHYNTVEVLTNDGLTRAKVVNMLQKVNVSVKKIPGFDALFPAPKTLFQDIPTPGKNVKKWEKQHNTGTSAKMDTFYPKDQPWLANVIARHYSNDYNNFRNYGIKPPPGQAHVRVRRRARVASLEFEGEA